jgi:hypothetical protein
MTTKIKVKFAQGCFDNFNGTQEELDALLSEVESWADGGITNIEFVDIGSLNEIDPEILEYIEQSEYGSAPRILH